jgi:hypothetical protein
VGAKPPFAEPDACRTLPVAPLRRDGGVPVTAGACRALLQVADGVAVACCDGPERGVGRKVGPLADKGGVGVLVPEASREDRPAQWQSGKLADFTSRMCLVNMDLRLLASLPLSLSKWPTRPRTVPPEGEGLCVCAQRNAIHFPSPPTPSPLGRGETETDRCNLVSHRDVAFPRSSSGEGVSVVRFREGARSSETSLRAARCLPDAALANLANVSCLPRGCRRRWPP